jgi:hypothetical protein
LILIFSPTKATKAVKTIGAGCKSAMDYQGKGRVSVTFELEHNLFFRACKILNSEQESFFF